MYNTVLTMAWSLFALTFFLEWYNFGAKNVMESPRTYLEYSIYLLKFCQLLQWVNVLLVLVGLSRTNLLSEMG